MKKDIIIPAAGESVTEADIVGWHKENGEFVNMDEPIVELETDKASMDLTAESAGVLTINVEDGTVQVGDIIGFITEGQGEKPTPAEPTTENTPEPVKVEKTEPESTNTYAAGHPSPAASKILDEKNITTNNVAGTGKDGRITKEDALKATPVQKEEPKKEPSTEPALPTKSGDRTIRREKMSRLRKTLMHRLVDAQQSTASLTTFNEIDMYEVMQIRKKYKESFKEKHGVGLGFMSFFTKAVTTALLNFPLINATIDGEEIVYHDYCDIGIAVATPKGLVVPVIKDAEQLNFHQIESSIRNFALKERWSALPKSLSIVGINLSIYSTTVTLLPKRPYTEPSSTPITPPPITIKCFGISFNEIASSDVIILFLSVGTLFNGVTEDPVAIINLSDVIVFFSVSLLTSIVCLSLNVA